MRKTIVVGLVSSAFGLQAAVFEFGLAGNGGAGLLPSNEIPPVTGSTASGTANGPIQYNDSNNQLTFNISFNVPSGATFASIKGPADINTGGADNLYTAPALLLRPIAKHLIHVDRFFQQIRRLVRDDA